MEIENRTKYHVGEIESALQKCKCKWQNNEASVAHTRGKR